MAGSLSELNAVDGDQGKAINDLVSQLKGFGSAGPTQDRLLNLLEESFYRGAAPYVRRILRLLELLLKCELEQLPRNRITGLLSAVNDANSDLSSLTSHKPGDRAENYPERMKLRWESLHSSVIPEILAANNLGTNSQMLANDLIVKIEDVRRRAEDTNDEIKSVLESARKASAEIGVSQQAIHFKNVADSYNRQSWIWLAFLVLFVAAGVVYAFFYLPSQLNSLPVDLPTSRLTQLIFNKVLIASLLFFGIGWLARNFSAARHNFVTNQHRQTALSTFETIVNGVKEDPQARNAVLVYASQAIFMPTNTGYGKGDIEVQQINPIVDLVSSARKLAP